jgi:hypothetical protein
VPGLRPADFEEPRHAAASVGDVEMADALEAFVGSAEDGGLSLMNGLLARAFARNLLVCDGSA